MKKIFSEAIKVKDGVFYNLPFHQDRINRTTKHFYGKHIDLNLTPDAIPPEMRKGLFKCRLEYTDELLSIGFIPYTFRVINSVAVVQDDEIQYSYKSVNREELQTLLKQSGADEIIIIKNDFVTDASSSNIVFKDDTGFYTPATYLLKGTKREYLLQQGIIHERIITKENIADYTMVYFINAMVDLEDEICFPVSKLVYPSVSSDL